MNIAAAFPEEPLLHLSSLQRRNPRAESVTAYDEAMAKFRKLQTEAHDLERWRDKDRLWSVPCGWLDNQIRNARSDAAEAWFTARGIAARMEAVRG